MSITDELRGYAQRYKNSHDAWSGIGDDLDAIADRIDAEHESVMYDMRREHDEWVANRDANWVKLPVDADGKVIHIGDVMENIVHTPTHREVTGVGVECFYAWRDDCDRYSQFGANCYRHHHAPTVEDVLYESLKHFGAVEERTPEVDEWLHEQAAKLRLAEEGE